MPGLVGYFGSSEPNGGEQLLGAMACALEPNPQYLRNIYTQTGCGFGCVYLEEDVWPPQIARNNNSNVTLAITGEITNIAELRSWCECRSVTIDDDGSAALILALYLEEGSLFASRLNGNFAIAIRDGRFGKLLLISDRLGLRPIYYALLPDRLTFATSVYALLADRSLSHQADLLAIAEFLALDHPLDDRTIFSSIKLLPPGSILTYQDSKISQSVYWQIGCPVAVSYSHEEDCVDTLLDLLRQSTKHSTQGGYDTGLMLSGGLDSRILLYFLNETLAGQNLETFTWGMPGCDDARFARQVSNLLNIPNRFYALDPLRLTEIMPEGVRRTGGLGNVVHMHSMASLEEQSAHCKLIYKGFFGDALMGFYDDPRLLTHYEVDDLLRLFYEYYGGPYRRDEQAAWFNPDFGEQIGSHLEDSLLHALTSCNQHLAADQLYLFDLTQRQPRCTLNGVELVRSRLPVGLPYCDNELVRFMLGTPTGLRFGRYLVKKAFVREAPKLSTIPYTHNRDMLVKCGRDLARRSEDWLRWRLYKLGVVSSIEPPHRPYADYDSWFRTILRPWVEDILLSKSSLERGYLKPDAIRNLVAQHMSGEKKHATRLGALLSLELWWRGIKNIEAL